MSGSTAQVSSLFTARETMSRTLNDIASSTDRLDRTFGRLRGRLRSAVEFNIVNRGMDLLWRGINNVVDALPDMIHRGERWAATIDSISDATGLSAEQASELAAVQQRVGGSTDALTRGFVALARSVYTNRDAWKEMGVKVALSRDGSVDAYRTFQNLRRAISDTGGSLLSTAAAQTALGRGGKDMLDLLQLTDRQYRLLAKDARDSGQVMTAQAAAAAEAWDRAQQRMGATLDGLGTRMLGGLAPVLTRFADGFTDFIQRNMDNLVRLVVGGANTVLTVIGDLLGMDLGTWSFTEQVGRAATTTERWGKGLRDTSKAHDKAAAATHGHASAVDTLRAAERELARLQASNVGFTGDKSEYEQERARQARLAAIADAKQRVADARKALHEMSKGAAAAGAAAGAAYWKGFGRGGGGGATKNGGVADIFGGMNRVITDSTKTGHEIADAIKDAIFGDEQIATVFGGSGSPRTFEIRSGGLIDQLRNVATFLGTVGGHLVNLNGFLGGPGGLVAGVLGLSALIRLIPGVPSLTQTGGGVLASLAKTPVGPLGIAAALNAFVRQAGPKQPDEYGIFGGMPGYDVGMAAAGPRVAAVRSAIWQAVASYLRLIFNGRPGGTGGGYPNPNQNPGMFPPPGGWPAAAGYSGWRTDGPDSPWRPNWDNIPKTLGFGINDPFGITLASVFRTWMGPSSDVVLGLGDVKSALYGVQTATENLSPTDTGGTGGGGTIVSRVNTLERQMTGVADSALKTANQRQDKAIKGLTRVNAVQGKDIRDRVTIANYNKGYAANKRQHQSFGNSIDDHERRLDRLDGGGGGDPKSGRSNRHASETATATRRTASNSDQMLAVLRDIRRELRGRPRGMATSSLRP